MAQSTLTEWASGLTIITATIPNITTIFTPPPSCLAMTFTISPGYDDAFINDGLSAPWVAAHGFDPRCYPPGMNICDTDDCTSTTLFSPAICPSGYYGLSTGFGGVDSDITSISCCPFSSATWDEDDFTRQCYISSDAISGAIVNGTQTESAIFAMVSAAPIVVVHQSSDLSLWATSSTTPTTISATPVQTPKVLSTSTSVAASPTSSASCSRQLGARLWVGVVALLGALSISSAAM